MSDFSDMARSSLLAEDLAFVRAGSDNMSIGRIDREAVELLVSGDDCLVLDRACAQQGCPVVDSCHWPIGDDWEKIRAGFDSLAEEFGKPKVAGKPDSREFARLWMNPLGQARCLRRLWV